jgi:hypothetical protein
VPRSIVRPALAVALVAAALAGCGLGAGSELDGDGVELRVTRDFGQELLSSERRTTIREDQTVMRLLRSANDIETRYGGNFVQFSRGWKRLKRDGAYGDFVRRSSKRGQTVTATVDGGQRVALIGRKLRRGGKLRVIVGGQNRLIRLRGTPRFRDVLWVSEPLPPGEQTLRLRSGRNPSEIDAVAVHP